LKRAAFFIFALALIFVLFLAARSASAQSVPTIISHQGKLLNSSNQPVTSNVSVVFSIYDAATSGNQVWTETQSITPDSLGFYDTFLGGVTALPSTLPNPSYLQITVQSETLSPRLQFGSVPFAQKAGGLQINTSTSKPTCNEQNRGTFWVTKDDASGDSTEVCKSQGLFDIKSATLPTPREGLSCVESLTTNKFYCFGAWYPQSNQIIEYNPINDTLVIKNATFPTGISGSSCVENSANNKIYCFGGRADNSRDNKIFEYNPGNDTLTQKNATLPTNREVLSCAENSSSHKIYCFGGFDNVGALDQIVEYDSINDTLTIKSSVLPTPRSRPSCAENTATHKIYCFGGSGTNQIIEYNTANDTVVVKGATLPSNRSGLSCAENSSQNKIFCFGGYDSTYLNQVLEYTPSTDTLTVKPENLPTGRYSLSCAENTATSRFFCFGGADSTGNLSQILEYPKLRMLWFKLD